MRLAIIFALLSVGILAFSMPVVAAGSESYHSSRYVYSYNLGRSSSYYTPVQYHRPSYRPYSYDSGYYRPSYYPSYRYSKDYLDRDFNRPYQFILDKVYTPFVNYVPKEDFYQGHHYGWDGVSTY